MPETSDENWLARRFEEQRTHLQAVAYRMLPNEERLGLHERVAQAIASGAGYRTGYDDAAVGRHWEMAGRIGEAADRYLAAAAHGVDIGGNSDAFRLLTRVLRLVPESDHARRFGARQLREEILRRLARRTQQQREIGVRLRPLTGMLMSGSYTYSDFTYRDFDTAGQSVSGKAVPGVPAHNVFAEVSYRTSHGLSAAFDIQRVGRFFLNDLNTASNEPYVVANLRVGYDFRLARGFELSPWLGLQNLRDSVYVAQTRPNAAADRYFNPLPGLTFLGGLKFGY
jgi:hypothetical protein